MLFSVFALSLSIASAAETCSKLRDCVALAGKLTGKQYVYLAAELQQEFKSTEGLSWTKENADGLLSETLLMAGFTRLPVPGAANTYSITNSRDIRYGGNYPSFSATRDGGDELPQPAYADFAELRYRSKNGGLRVGEITRNLRPFLSRYGRAIDTAEGGIVVVDIQTNLRRILALIRQQDVAVSKAEAAYITKRLARAESSATSCGPASPVSSPAGPSPTKP